MRQSARWRVDPAPKGSLDSDCEPEIPQRPEMPGVLLVDDDQAVQTMLRPVLERSGFETWIAANCRDGLALYREHRHRIVALLLGIRPRALEGPGLLDLLLRLTSGVPCCCLSDEKDADERDELIRRGAALVLDKQTLLEELADFVGKPGRGAATDS
jgi:DNA-binding NtrC family response regulator